MKIYFTTSFHFEKLNPRLCEIVLKYLKDKRHEVLTYVFTHQSLSFNDLTTNDFKDFYRRWMTYINNCDFALIEGSYPSTMHIGYEIGTILSKGKPIVLLYEAGHDPVFINEYCSTRLVKIEYTQATFLDNLIIGFEEVMSLVNHRFTLNIPAEIDNYLNVVSERDSISRSEFIRMLIDRQMKQDK